MESCTVKILLVVALFCVCGGNNAFSEAASIKSFNKNFTFYESGEKFVLTRSQGPVFHLDEHKWYRGGKPTPGQEYKFDDHDETTKSKPSDILATFNLEPQGTFYITEVWVLVDQSSTIGQAYIEDGGIGFDRMRLRIFAKDATFLNYKVIVFGRNYQ